MIEDTAAPTGLFTDDHQVTRCVWCRKALGMNQLLRDTLMATELEAA